MAKKKQVPKGKTLWVDDETYELLWQLRNKYRMAMSKVVSEAVTFYMHMRKEVDK